MIDFDSPEIKQQLDAIRIVRNLFGHSKKSTDQYIFQLKKNINSDMRKAVENKFLSSKKSINEQ